MKDVRIVSYQKKFDYSYSFGVFPTLELLQNHPLEVIKVILSPRGKQNQGVGKIIQICKAKQIRTEWNEGAIIHVGGNENTYAVGVFAKYIDSLEGGTNHLILVSPEDTGNLGTILRTCLGFGVENVGIIKPGVDVFDPKTVRASMGALYKLKVQYFENIEEYQGKHSNCLYPFMTDAKNGLETVTFTTPFALVFGGESSGLGAEFTDLGTPVYIRQSEKIDSLNLATAVAIGLYETFR